MEKPGFCDNCWKVSSILLKTRFLAVSWAMEKPGFCDDCWQVSSLLLKTRFLAMFPLLHSMASGQPLPFLRANPEIIVQPAAASI